MIPPSPAQLEYILNQKVYNIAEGAVRSGKTVMNVMLYALNLESSKDDYHLATAVTIGNAKVILGECNGYGLKHIYGDRARYTTFRDKEAMVIDTFNNGRKWVIFAGGMKAKDENNIVGMSFGSWIATEIDRHHPSFIKEAIRRLAIADNMKVYWDLNPNVPSHFIYKDYIDLYNTTRPNLINYHTFTIFDNRAFNETQLDIFLANYEVNSIWYKRDVLGQRINLTGSIYPNFEHQKHLNDIKSVKKPFVRYFIGIDWGYSGSATAFILVGEHTDGTIQVLDEVFDNSEYRSAQDNLKQAFAFIEKYKHYYPIVYPDCADIGMLRDLQRQYSFVKNYKKPKIHDRIRLLDKLLANNMIHISKECRNVISSLDNAQFDTSQSKNIRLDNGSYNVDSLDALEYALTDIFYRIERNELLILTKEDEND